MSFFVTGSKDLSILRPNYDDLNGVSNVSVLGPVKGWTSIVPIDVQAVNV